jgi:ureidoacrylate peracid hydrolase
MTGMLTTLAEKVRPAHTALLIIDYQNDFCHEDGVFAQAGFDVSTFRAIEANLLELLATARQAGVHPVWIRNAYNSRDGAYLSPVFLEHAIRRWNGRYSRIPVCEEGSWGQDFYGGVRPLPGERIVTKHRYDAFIGTNLEVILRAISARTVVVTGVTTNFCVESTVRHAFCLDYYSVVPTNAVAHWDSAAHDAALKNIEYGFGQLSTVAEIAAHWRHPA